MSKRICNDHRSGDREGTTTGEGGRGETRSFPRIDPSAGEEGRVTMSWEYEALFNRQDKDSQQLDMWSSLPTAIRIGRMGYRTRTTWAGDRLEAEVYPIYGRSDTTRARIEKAHATREAQKKLNDRRAEHRLILLAEANFTSADYHMTLTYAEEPSEKRAVKDIKNFFQRVRRMRKSRNLPPLKYIYAMGGGEEDDEKRIHFHLMINGGISREDLESCWLQTPGAGRVNTDRLQPNERGLEELSKYIFRQHKDRVRARAGEGENIRRYNASRNLKQPKSSTSDSRCSNARVRRIAHDIRNEAKVEMETVYTGYRFVECRVYYSDVIDGVYIRCVMRKNQEGKKHGRL